jgi:hypothetical protein
MRRCTVGVAGLIGLGLRCSQLRPLLHR